MSAPPTGLHIVPDVASPNGKMLLRVPLKTRKEPFRDIPLKTGLKLVNKRRPAAYPLLPVLVKISSYLGLRP